MPGFKQKRYFLVILLLLASSVLMGGGCVGDSSSVVGGGGSGSTIVEAVPQSPAQLDLGSKTKTIGQMKSVTVPVRIVVDSPVENVVCVMRLVSGDVDYDPNTFKVSPAAVDASRSRGDEGDEKEWMATSLIPNVTPDVTDYTATFDLLNTIEGGISGQFEPGLDLSAVFYTVHVGSVATDEDETVGDVDSTALARGEDEAEEEAQENVSEYFFLGSVETPDYDPDTTFSLEVASVAFDSPHLLVESDDVDYNPASEITGEYGLFIGIPVQMELSLKNTAATSITIKSASDSTNVDFSSVSEHINVETVLLDLSAESFKSSDFVGGTSELKIAPFKTPIQAPVHDDYDDDYGDAELTTFAKQSTDGDDEGTADEALGVSFILGVKITGEPSWGILEYLSDDKSNNPLTKLIELNTPITVEVAYDPKGAVTDEGMAEGLTHSFVVNTAISDDAQLFTTDIRLLLEGVFEGINEPDDIVGDGEGQEDDITPSRSASVFDYDSGSIWNDTKTYSKYAGKEKFFKSGVEATAKAYSRAFGVGFKVDGKVPMHVLSKQKNLIHIIAQAFMGDSSKTASGYTAVSSKAGLKVYAFDIKLHEKEWDLKNTTKKTEGEISFTKEFSLKKSFYEYLIPVTLKAGVRGTLGVKPTITFSDKMQNLSIFIIPFLDTQAFAAAELDVYVFRAGIGAGLRMIKYEFIPGISFTLVYENGKVVSGKQMVLGIKPTLEYKIDHKLSTLDGWVKLYFDRRKYIVFGKWKNIKTYTLISWGGWSKTWNMCKGPILTGKTIWYPKK